MSEAAEFESDVFISYAHLDNQPAYPGETPWVDAFHTALRAKVTSLLDRLSWAGSHFHSSPLFQRGGSKREHSDIGTS